MNEFVNPYTVRIEIPGKAANDLDLTEFFVGGNASTVSKRTQWSGDYRGRPKLAAEFADLLATNPPSDPTASSWRSAMRSFFRFLEEREDRCGEQVDSCADITDAHGPAFRIFLPSESHYKLVKGLLNNLRALNGCGPLFWTAPRPDALRQQDPIDGQAIRKFSHALRHEGRAIQANFAKGESLASAGRDPRGCGSAAFDVPENRAWLMRELLKSDLPGRTSMIKNGAYRLMAGAGASHLAPGLSPKYAGGYGAAVRWFVPAYSDIAVFFNLFVIATGWNAATACAIDVSEDDWWQPHPQTELFAVLHAWKNRAGKHQFAISLRKPEWHPFRVLEYVLGITAPLRAVVNRRLADLRARYGEDPSDELAAEILHHERLSRTPWLFASFERMGEVSGITSQTKTDWLNDYARETIKRHGLDARFPRLANYKVSDARDAWIGFAYVSSGYNLLLTRLASQHANTRTLKHYLRATRYRRHSEREVSKLHHALFSEIEAGRPVDTVRLRLLVKNGAITPEQEQRLSDRRARTRLGTGCLDPRSPPKRIAPDHPEGALCRVQRCIGCSHGIVFSDSMPALARALAELRHVRLQMPVASWDGSSFEAEHDGLERTLEGFEAAAVAAELTAWSEKLRTGEAQANVIYPSY